jgi:hypothetical protein
MYKEEATEDAVRENATGAYADERARNARRKLRMLSGVVESMSPDDPLQKSLAPFNWWERIFHYRWLVSAVKDSGYYHGLVWRLFYEVVTQQLHDAMILVTLLSVESKTVPSILSYFKGYKARFLELAD